MSNIEISPEAREAALRERNPQDTLDIGQHVQTLLDTVRAADAEKMEIEWQHSLDARQAMIDELTNRCVKIDHDRGLQVQGIQWQLNDATAERDALRAEVAQEKALCDAVIEEKKLLGEQLAQAKRERDAWRIAAETVNNEARAQHSKEQPGIILIP